MRKKYEQLFPKLLVEVHRTALGRSVPDNPGLSESDLVLGMTPVPILQVFFNVVQTATDPHPPLLRFERLYYHWLSDPPLPSWNVPGPCNSPERAVPRHFFLTKVFCKYTKFASTFFDHWFYPPTLYFNNVKKDCTFGTGGHPLPASFVTWPLKIKMTNYKLHVPSLVSKLPVLNSFIGSQCAWRPKKSKKLPNRLGYGKWTGLTSTLRKCNMFDV